jgi:capsular polysaccharide biosynthesis protein
MEIDLNVQYYIDIVIKHWRAVVVVFVVATLAAAVASYLQQPMYQATVTLVEGSYEYFDNPRLSSLDKTVVKYYDTLAHTEAVEARVIEALGPSLDPAEKEPGVLLSMVTVQPDRENPVIFRIRAQASTAQKATQIANAWAEQYMEEVTGFESTWGDQLAQLDQELESAEAALTTFRQQTGLFVIEDPTGYTAFVAVGPRVSQLEKIVDLWAEHQQARDNVRLVLESAQEARDTGGGVEDLPLQLLSTPVISERGQLSVKTVTELGDLDAVIQALKAEDEILASVVDRMEQEVEGLQKELAEDLVELERLERARDLAENTDKALRDEIEEALLFQTHTQVVSKATRAKLVGPNPKLNVILGAALGLAAGVLAAFVLEYFESVRAKGSVSSQ